MTIAKLWAVVVEANTTVQNSHPESIGLSLTNLM